MTDAATIAKGKREALERRFWAKVAKLGPDDCWIWQGKPSSRGYGRIETEWSSSFPAHKLAMILVGAEIPSGYVVDHICRNRLCTNPAHLRAVTPRINTIENSMAVTAINSRKTHCYNGHELSGENVKFRKGSNARICRTCQRRAYSASYYRRKAILAQETDR